MFFQRANQRFDAPDDNIARRAGISGFETQPDFRVRIPAERLIQSILQAMRQIKNAAG